MTIALAATGSATGGTASTAPAYPDNANAGDLLVIPVQTSSDDDATPTAPSPWQTAVVVTGGSGSHAPDDGPRTATIFVKEADGTESTGQTVTITNPGTGGTGRSTAAHILRFTKTLSSWETTATGGMDNTAGTAYSAFGAANLNADVGDLVLFNTTWVPDSNTPNTPTTDGLSIAGCTFGTSTQIKNSNTTQGDDLRYIVGAREIATGPSTAAPLYARTASLSVTGGATAFLRLREVAAGTTGNLPTATETDSATALTGAKTGSLPVASTQDTATAFTGAKAGTLTAATETDTAQSVVGAKTAAIPLASELDHAVDFTVGAGPPQLPPALETDTASTLTAAKAGSLPVADELDTATALTGAKTGVLPTAIELDAAVSPAAAKLGQLPTAPEIDAALPLSATALGLLPPATETDTAITLGGIIGEPKDVTVTIGPPRMGTAQVGTTRMGSVSIGDMRRPTSVIDVLIGQPRAGSLTVAAARAGSVSMAAARMGSVDVGDTRLGSVDVGQTRIERGP